MIYQPTTSGSISSGLLSRGQRRLEASTYLTSGYGLRKRIEAQHDWTQLGDLCSIWQPSRLKGYETEPNKGYPFFSAGQMFEQSPMVRKWISKAYVPQPESRFVDEKMLMLSCSGIVGKITAVYPHHLNKIITHDLLRVVPKEDSVYNWLYAFMRTPLFQAIASSEKYGHMIKHLEVKHASAFPVLLPDPHARENIDSAINESLKKRRQAFLLRQEAFELFEQAIEREAPKTPKTTGFSIVGFSKMRTKRRRLDAAFYSESYQGIEEKLSSFACDNLSDLCQKIAHRNRFTRHFSDGSIGIPYVSANEVFDLNAPITKHIYKKLVDNHDEYILHKNWLVMACSGQTYGLLGRVALIGQRLDGVFGTHDLIRIEVDDEKIEPGYLFTFLNDPKYGRPSVVRFACGTSIPHLEPTDIQNLKVPRLTTSIENEIAKKAELATAFSDEADALETKATEEATLICEQMI